MAAKGRSGTDDADALGEYRRKRSFEKTPEPRGRKKGSGSGSRFVVHEHHARRLHWDLRLEHNGVLASWALPRGIPETPEENRLAVHTEDHPLEYLTFHGEIPTGEYGAGSMTVWDTGTYEAEKFGADKVVIRLYGERVQGKFALFQTDDRNWMMHRMDPPERPREPMPDAIAPMAATLATLPYDDDAWGYEIKWDGVRTIAYCEPGRLRLVGRNLRESTRQYPEIRALSEQLGSRRVILDGEIVAFDDAGRPSFERIQPRIHVTAPSDVQRLQRSTPVVYVIFDLLYLDDESLMKLPYEQRRERLESLEIGGPNWQVPAYQRGGGDVLLQATKDRGLEGVIAKRLDSLYRPGQRSRDWLKVKNSQSQEVVIGGWVAGKGQLAGVFGALLVGTYDDGELRYAGKVGSGFDYATRKSLQQKLATLRRATSPFVGRQPQRDSVFVEPELVCEVEFGEWTSSGTLRHPRYKGLRKDKDPREVVRETAG